MSIMWAFGTTKFQKKNINQIPSAITLWTWILAPTPKLTYFCFTAMLFLWPSDVPECQFSSRFFEFGQNIIWFLPIWRVSFSTHLNWAAPTATKLSHKDRKYIINRRGNPVTYRYINVHRRPCGVVFPFDHHGPRNHMDVFLHKKMKTASFQSGG